MKCDRCGLSGVAFHLPTAWEGGICEPCALGDPNIYPTFKAHFGTIQHISDGDKGKGIPKT